jgi:hypothetical protein
MAQIGRAKLAHFEVENIIIFYHSFIINTNLSYKIEL